MDYDRVASLLVALDYCTSADAQNAALLTHLIGNGFTPTEAQSLLVAIRNVPATSGGWDLKTNKGSPPSSAAGGGDVKTNKGFPPSPPAGGWGVKTNNGGSPSSAAGGGDVKTNNASSQPLATGAERGGRFVVAGPFRRSRLLS